MDERQVDEGQSSLEDFFSPLEESSPEESPINASQNEDASISSDANSTKAAKDSSSVESDESDVVEVKIGNKELPTDLPPSFLLSVDYSGPDNKAVARLYRPDTKEVFFWLDNTGHKPYFYTDLPPQAVQSIASKNRGFVGTETVELHDLLRDESVTMTKVIGDNPLAIGGRQDSIRNLMADKNTGATHAWEAAIRYQLCYTYDTNLVPGLMYKIEKGDLIPVPPKVDAATIKEFKKTIQDDKSLESVIAEY
ncbi:MAG: hypothetical protein ACXAAO_00265 [Candidatus Thorarchaeota archaeon]|jgi:DNA polymerase I